MEEAIRIMKNSKSTTLLWKELKNTDGSSYTWKTLVQNRHLHSSSFRQNQGKENSISLKH